MLFETADNEAGKLARSLAAEINSLWVFLDEHAVDPTNNRAERALRFGVLWRKRSLGSQSDKGLRWVERILSLKETCRIKGKAPFPVLVDMVSAYFKEQMPNLAWIGQLQLAYPCEQLSFFYYIFQWYLVSDLVMETVKEKKADG